jgi:hypothetical protein
LPSDPSAAAHVLSTARKALVTSRGAFKALSPDERGVIKRARNAVAETPKGRVLAPAFGAAADLLERASAEAKGEEDLLACMAKTYRAMAEELDKDASYLTDEQKAQAPAERADSTLAAVETLLASAAEGKPESLSWDRLKRLDPRYRALAVNMRTIARGYATLGKKDGDEKLAATIASATKLHGALEPYFEGVADTRPPEVKPVPDAGAAAG